MCFSLCFCVFTFIVDSGYYYINNLSSLSSCMMVQTNSLLWLVHSVGTHLLQPIPPPVPAFTLCSGPTCQFHTEASKWTGTRMVRSNTKLIGHFSWIECKIVLNLHGPFLKSAMESTTFMTCANLKALCETSRRVWQWKDRWGSQNRRK